MALNTAQKDKIDAMICNNKKSMDILQELVANQGADVRDVNDYLKENKTLQGMLKTITHRTKDLSTAGDAASRAEIAKEVEKLSKKAIRILQTKAKE